MNSEWHEVAAQVIGVSVEYVAEHSPNRSFASLGGTSLAAAELTALIERRFGRRLDLGLVLGVQPLAYAMSASRPAPPPAMPPEPPRLREPLDGQDLMLNDEELRGGTAFHLMFTLMFDGVVDVGRMRDAIAILAERHETLRTSFVRVAAGGIRRVTHDRWTPPLHDQHLPPSAGGADLLTTVHDQLAKVSATSLRPFAAPPVAFFLTRAGGRPETAVTVLIHHSLIDGWGVGLLLRDLVELYAASSTGLVAVAATAGPEHVMAYAAELRPGLDERAGLRAGQLAGAPTTATLPSRQPRPEQFTPSATRLVFTLPDAVRRACDALAADAGVTKTAVLLAAWALVVARRCETEDLLVGMPMAHRPTADLMAAVALCTRMAPVRCRIRSDSTVRDYVRGCAEAIGEAVGFADIAFDRLVTEMRVGGEIGRNPLVQIAFAAHDELVPGGVTAGDVTASVHEGHCGGTVFDALLYVQRWSPEPVLALEYATAVLAPDEAAELADALIATVSSFAADADAPIEDVRAVSDRQHDLERAWSHGAVAAGLPGLWQLFADQVAQRPDAAALRDDTRELTYRELGERAEDLARQLVHVGVRAGDRVVIGLPSGVDEIVAVLATIRLGAAYVGVDMDAPAAHREPIFKIADPVAVVTNEPDQVWPGGVRSVSPDAVGTAELPPPPPADPQRVAYIAFTSGSTGRPKGVRVPERGVVRLVHEADYIRRGPGEVMLRLAPLAFDASTLEIFAPLTGGAAVAAYPSEPPSPARLHEFLTAHRVTVAWLTAGLFRIVADHRLECFAGLRQLLTGGDVVPAAQVRSLLEHYPQLRVTNGYGPTENTTFTTVQHFDHAVDVPDDLPIGRPVGGTILAVLDGRRRAVPPGGVGELYVAGLGVALDYAGDETATAEVFHTMPGPDGVRWYRTGDIVRWDRGRLMYLGRRDRQVKVAGHRIELAAIEQACRAHPEVLDVYVGAVPAGGTVGLVAGVVAANRSGLVEEISDLVAQSQPRYAVPSRWVVVDAMPLTHNGKVDLKALTALAQSGGAPAAQPQGTQRIDLEQVLTRIWEEVLGHDDFDADDGFFDIGGSSILLMAVRDRLRSELPAQAVNVVDLYRFPSVASLARHLQAGAA